MKIISCGICSISMLYPSLIPVIYIARIITNKNITVHSYEQIPFFNTLMVHLGQLLAGLICFLISLFLHREAKDQDSPQRDKKKPLITILINKKKTRSFYVYFIILMIVMLDGISITSQALLTFYEQGEQLAIMMKVFQLYTTTFISKALLKISFYKHQGLAIALITLGSVPMIHSFFLLNHQEVVLTISFFFSLLIVNAFGISFYGIAQKHLFEKEFFSLTEIMVLEGVTGFVLNIVFIMLTSIPCNTFNWFCDMMYIVPNNYNIRDWVFGNYKRTLFATLSVVLSGCLNVCYALTNKIYNPTHRAISDCFCYVFLYVYDFIMVKEQMETWKLAFQWGGNVLLVLGNLIYCEYIILYCCSLQKNTKKEITRRSNEEIKQCIEINHLNLIDFNHDD